MSKYIVTICASITDMKGGRIPSAPSRLDASSLRDMITMSEESVKAMELLKTFGIISEYTVVMDCRNSSTEQGAGP